MDLVTAVKAHAIANYETGGWDVIVECWDDEAIAKEITEEHATTVAEAIAVFAPAVDVWADRQADARISSGCICTDGSISCRCFY